MILQVERVSSQYEDKVLVLRDITMNAAEGKTTCVLGPNGAGKSTLLKTIVGLVKPRGGEIRFSDVRIDHLKTHRIIEMGISVVPEYKQLFPKLTVKETLRLGAYFLSDEKVLGERMEKIFEIFPHIRDRLEQLTGTLSGGELGMLSIARALMAEPKMMLLDEPSFGLAPIITRRVFETIQEINIKGITILLIEQNVKKSLDISAYGYLLQKGQIVNEGDNEKLRSSELVKKAYIGG